MLATASDCTPKNRSLLAEATISLMALGGYAIVSVALVGPKLSQLNTVVLSDSGDGISDWWNIWWVRHALVDLHTNPYITSLFWYDQGTPLYFHTLTPINGLMAIPLVPLLGETL